jgi:flagellar biosynthesis/type III secretory pathway protein FliH
MILRNATLSDEVRSLRPTAIERSASPTHAPAIVPEVNARGSRGSDIVAVTDAVDKVRAESPPPLTFEAVAAWLTVQDLETRTACASLLAEELTLAHEHAKMEGFRAGQAAGLQQARAEGEAEIARLREIGAAASAQLANELPALVDACADIVSAAFIKLAGPALVTREAAVGAVEQVLRQVKEGNELTIRVNAADVAAIRAVEAELSNAFRGRKLNVVGDARIELGGCIVESKLGSLDGRFESQLRELFESIRAARAAAGERQ